MRQSIGTESSLRYFPIFEQAHTNYPIERLQWLQQLPVEKFIFFLSYTISLEPAVLPVLSFSKKSLNGKDSKEEAAERLYYLSTASFNA